jgi:hypothetical protein
MAQSSGGIGEVLGIAALAAAAWFVYETFFSGTTVAATTPVTTPPATTTTTPPATTTSIVIPAGFTVTPDINNSWKGTVTYSGSPATFNLIYSGGAPTGQVFSSAGVDVTSTLGAANVTALVNAFQNASNVFIAQGGNVPAGMGQYVPIRVPHAIIPRRTIAVPVRRRMEAV